MKLIRKATAVWKGNLKNGDGRLNTETGALKNKKYSFSSRFENGEGTNPEELIAAAHAGCFSMALSAGLAKEGYETNSIETEDHVHLEKSAGGFSISKIEISTIVDAPDIDNETFRKTAEDAKRNCPVSRALAGVEFVLEAVLKKEIRH